LSHLFREVLLSKVSVRGVLSSHASRYFHIESIPAADAA
jgi:hypothetical protein